MAYIIDAWLECAHPHLKVMNSRSGMELFSFQEKEVHQLLENGDIDINDLFSTNQQTLEEVVKQLVLFRCSQTMHSTAA